MTITTELDQLRAQLPKVNERLLDETVAAIAANKKRWDQSVWRTVAKKPAKAAAENPNNATCGTAMCFAGWAATLDRPRWLIPDNKALALAKEDPEFEDDMMEYVLARQDEIAAGVAVTMLGKQAVRVEIRAKRVLGLIPVESAELFNGGANLTELRQVVKRIKRGEYRQTREQIQKALDGLNNEE